MRHEPHLFLPGPWTTESIQLGDGHRHHLGKVLRVGDGQSVSYTDGEGRVGRGTIIGRTVLRGDETDVPPGVPALTVAAVPLHDRQRNRFMVEKLAELGTRRLLWWRSEYGQARPPSKAQMWADQALEQSRGAWRLVVSTAGVEQLPAPVVVAHPQGGPWPDEAPATVLIGPEGGWSEADLSPEWTRVSLGTRLLRSETAAVVAAARVLNAKSDSRDQ